MKKIRLTKELVGGFLENCYTGDMVEERMQNIAGHVEDFEDSAISAYARVERRLKTWKWIEKAGSFYVLTKKGSKER